MNIKIPLLLWATSLSVGCAPVIGNATGGLTTNRVIPQAVLYGDVTMACAMGEALSPLITSFEEESKKARKSSIIAYLASAICAEQRVQETELGRLRALHGGDVASAKDQHALEKRQRMVAAGRYLSAFEQTLVSYGAVEEGGACPKLRNDDEEFQYLMGMSAGVLAVLHNNAVGNQAGDTSSVPGVVLRGAPCLDSDKWWGAPLALESAIRALLPGGSQGTDPWASFEETARQGNAAGVRLASAFYVQSAATMGDRQALEAAIAGFLAAESPPEDASRWQMLDNYAEALIVHQSDLIWTNETGHRTPFDALGTYPDTVQDTEPDEFVDLLDDLTGP